MSPSARKIEIFLSHRYRSPAVNLYFLDVLRAQSELQLFVEGGDIPTCVTRLEKRIRTADAFVGVYPIPGPDEDAGIAPGADVLSPEALRKASRYFRLEIDLAVRSRCPAIIFADHRYGGIIESPPSIEIVTFVTQEILNSPTTKSANRLNDAMNRFFSRIDGFIHWRAAELDSVAPRTACMLLPENDRYTPQVRDVITAEFRKLGIKLTRAPWPPGVDAEFFGMLQTSGMVLVDISGKDDPYGLAQWCHAQGIPSIRYLHESSDPSPLEGTIFSNEAGYPKDIIRWTDAADAAAQTARRLQIIEHPAVLLASAKQAEAYFQLANRRPQSVFLSYRSKDTPAAAPIAAALRTRFSGLFDFQDRVSIPAGKDWLQTISRKIDESQVGVALLSPDYFESPRCTAELQQMIVKADEGNYTLVPIRLIDKFDMPGQYKVAQHLLASGYPTPAALVQEIERLLELNLRQDRSPPTTNG